MNLIEKVKAFFGYRPGKLFDIGQDITPKFQINWVHSNDKTKAVGPRFGQVVKVVRYNNLDRGVWYINITGFTNPYNEDIFAPLITDGELQELLEESIRLTEKV